MHRPSDPIYSTSRADVGQEHAAAARADAAPRGCRCQQVPICVKTACTTTSRPHAAYQETTSMHHQILQGTCTKGDSYKNRCDHGRATSCIRRPSPIYTAPSRRTSSTLRSALHQTGLHRPEHTRQAVRLHQDTSRSSSSSTSPIKIVVKVYIHVVFRRRRQKPAAAVIFDRRRRLRQEPAAAVIFDRRRRLRQNLPPPQNRCRRRTRQNPPPPQNRCRRRP
jgi:hypothetical protein